MPLMIIRLNCSFINFLKPYNLRLVKNTLNFVQPKPKNMKRQGIPFIKICCINNTDEAALAVKYGASALGLVGKMPSGPGVIEDSAINEIARSVPPPVSTFLLTSETSAIEIVDHYQRTWTNSIQLVDRVDSKTYKVLREKLPWVKLVQVVHVIDDSSVKYALEISSYADALLLDSGNPKGKVKKLGGTGKTHNWSISREIRLQSEVPVFLAGGLTSENVAEAIKTVNPYGIDVCSGVRTNGELDPNKLEKFMKQINIISND